MTTVNYKEKTLTSVQELMEALSTCVNRTGIFDSEGNLQEHGRTSENVDIIVCGNRVTFNFNVTIFDSLLKLCTEVADDYGYDIDYRNAAVWERPIVQKRHSILSDTFSQKEVDVLVEELDRRREDWLACLEQDPLDAGSVLYLQTVSKLQNVLKQL